MNPVNPFEPPKAELIAEGNPDGPELAGRGQRLGAAIIDALIGNLLTLLDVLFVFRSDRRCVHDLIAGTQVLRC